ncbi:hypothetical protein UFOVP1522_38 [uncultured Caudovirales phage]|uniref:Uncharacterized protein n=1 Tax=uncultured Caudovirales phage TaxID=2100421 RepID=A0A6J5Q8R8_9CAUD|nr:hypothetical protein UFOVP989_49 [uncultured Caudovirales phage]CAB4181130.1 hypothetical protein UFOVP1075_17 [uncultured Caudovirales phage]CAB4198718.1 hypothetical protein UFOVP1312_9 [uncultured Caudovirales phage]CAB4210870.1 hypothetical protein UFOVP1426_49 [uncultured Caudovirales phage]CAB5227428.1 hypothetical protein UFOVP1522_38 [uncultured Caudovirales phage]
MARIPQVDEIKIIALIARGDSHAQIINALKEDGSSTTSKTITAIAKRNQESLALITNKLIAFEESNVLDIKRKANSIIEKRLDQVDIEAGVLAKAHQQYIDEEIQLEDYIKLLRTMKSTSIPELVAVSKEMHVQERAKEAPINTPPQDMTALAAAIETGDEITLNQLIFKKNAESKTLTA